MFYKVVDFDTFFNGKMVILNHGLGLNSIYSHLNKIHVKVGEQIIGLCYIFILT